MLSSLKNSSPVLVAAAIVAWLSSSWCEVDGRVPSFSSVCAAVHASDGRSAALHVPWLSRVARHRACCSTERVPSLSSVCAAVHASDGRSAALHVPWLSRVARQRACCSTDEAMVIRMVERASMLLHCQIQAKGNSILLVTTIIARECHEAVVVCFVCV